MKRRLLYIGIAAAIAVSCAEQSESTSTDSEKEMFRITVNASKQSDAQSRVALNPTDDGGIDVSWSDESETINVFNPTTSSFAEYTMVEGSLSDDHQTASFEGEKIHQDGEQIRLLNLKGAVGMESIEDNFLNGVLFTLLDIDTIDMSDNEGLGTLGDNPIMISDLFDPSDPSSAPTMKHLTATIRVGLRIDGLDDSLGYTIDQMALISSSQKLPVVEILNLAYDVDDESFVENSDDDSMLLYDVANSPVITNYSETGKTYYLNIQTFPFTIASGDTIEIGIALKSDVPTHEREIVYFSVSNNGAEDFELPRASYSYLNDYLDVEITAEGSIEDWWDAGWEEDLQLDENKDNLTSGNNDSGVRY